MYTPPIHTSSWGSATHDMDVRAFRRYNQILCWSARIGEVTVFILIIGFIAGFLMLLNTNFENVIFYDGTDAPCLFKGISGEISHVR